MNNQDTLPTDAREDIIELILQDHKPLKALIKTLKDGDIPRSEKEGLYEEFVPLLMTHAKAEEKSLYMQMKEFDELRKESIEGDTEHAIADQLIHEINAAADDQVWGAKVKVLAEVVEHHLKEEESEMLENVEKQIDVVTRRELGAIYVDLRTEMEAINRPSVPPPRNLENRVNP